MLPFAVLYVSLFKNSGICEFEFTMSIPLITTEDGPSVGRGRTKEDFFFTIRKYSIISPNNILISLKEIETYEWRKGKNQN